MTPESNIPDSPDELIRQAALGNTPPTTTRLPQFNFSMQDGPGGGSGPLDFTAVVDQLILTSQGVPVIQLLHAASYLVASAARGLLASLKEGQDQPATLFTVMADLSQIEHCLKALDSVTSMPTNWHVNHRLGEGDSSEQSLHRCMVSQATIKSLGLDPDAFDRYFFDLIKVRAYTKSQDD